MPQTVACERARRWAALAPDGSLSSFERRLLDTHLARCAACAEFAAGVAAAAEAIRGAALVELPYPISIPSRRRRLAAGALAPVAAAAAVVLLTLSVGSVDLRSRPAPSSGDLLVVVAQPTDGRRELRELREARREQLVAAANHVAVERFRPGVHL